MSFLWIILFPACHLFEDAHIYNTNENYITTVLKDTGTVEDMDGDGWDSDVDCNDSDATVHPGAEEVVADGLDQDCDGGDLCYQDGDGDGYGSTITLVDIGLDCTGAGESLWNTDCDDSSVAIHPDADELCDGMDNDCDGRIDEDTIDTMTWYADNDGDGYGDVGSILETCNPPTGYTDDNTDCDDGDSLIYPNASEACGIGIDQDCDGLVDCEDPDCIGPTGCDHKGILMQLIPAGTFTMGSPENEVGRLEHRVQHEVTLSQDFWIGTYEVTQAQFEMFMGYQPSYFDYCPECPVENISWYEAVAFANAISVLAGLVECYSCSGSGDSLTCNLDSRWASPYECEGYRLPTEAEWEYAARAGTTSAFSNGGNLLSGTESNCDGALLLDNGTLLDDIAIYCGNADHPEQVGSLEPNPWGLYDMHGNVWEYCNDWYGELSSSPVADPVGASTADGRVIRSGSTSAPYFTRSSYCHTFMVSGHYQYLGLRLSKSSL